MAYLSFPTYYNVFRFQFRDCEGNTLQLYCVPNSEKSHSYMSIERLTSLTRIIWSTGTHRHSNSGPPPLFPHLVPPAIMGLWYGSLYGSISLNHLSIVYNISCYNSLALLTFVSRSSCRFTRTTDRESCNTKCCKIWINGSKIYFQTKIHTIIAGGTKWGKRGVRNSSACAGTFILAIAGRVYGWPDT
jgi:hypothetical protein